MPRPYTAEFQPENANAIQSWFSKTHDEQKLGRDEDVLQAQRERVCEGDDTDDRRPVWWIDQASPSVRRNAPAP